MVILRGRCWHDCPYVDHGSVEAAGQSKSGKTAECLSVHGEGRQTLHCRTRIQAPVSRTAHPAQVSLSKQEAESPWSVVRQLFTLTSRSEKKTKSILYCIYLLRNKRWAEEFIRWGNWNVKVCFRSTGAHTRVWSDKYWQDFISFILSLPLLPVRNRSMVSEMTETIFVQKKKRLFCYWLYLYRLTLQFPTLQLRSWISMYNFRAM